MELGFELGKIHDVTSAIEKGEPPKIVGLTLLREDDVRGRLLCEPPSPRPLAHHTCQCVFKGREQCYLWVVR